MDCHIILLLDNSASMDIQANQIQTGMDNFILKQQTITDNSYFSLLTFSDKINIIYDCIKFNQINHIQPYITNGSTKLYDSIAFCINKSILAIQFYC